MITLVSRSGIWDQPKLRVVVHQNPTSLSTSPSEARSPSGLPSPLPGTRSGFPGASGRDCGPNVSAPQKPQCQQSSPSVVGAYLARAPHSGQEMAFGGSLLISFSNISLLTKKIRLSGI